MTSKLKEYQSIKNRIEQMQEQINAIAEDDDFKADLAFLTELENLLEKHGKSKIDTAELLNPRKANDPAPFDNKPRKKREPRTYKNPHTGEVVTTSGGNHTVLKQWRADNPDVDLKDWIV